MTLCIATISEQGTAVIGVSDRMITVGHTFQYEPHEKKIVPITEKIFIMFAGDLHLNAEIISAIQKTVKESAKHWQVSEIANMYHEFATSIPSERNWKKALSSFGLDMNSFIEKQSTMHQGFLDAVMGQAKAEEIPAVQAIIAGIDSTGAHLFKKDDDEGGFVCADYTGYAVIGSGRWLAEAELTTRMAYAKFVGVAQSAFICLIAKRIAESSVGVGKATDILFVTEGYMRFFPEPLLTELNNRIGTMRLKETEIQIEFLTDWTEYVKKAENKIESNTDIENDEAERSAPAANEDGI